MNLCMTTEELLGSNNLGFSKLPSDTLAALQEFYSDRESRETRFQDLKSEIEQEQSQAQLTMDMFSEDWNASQFWVKAGHVYYTFSYSHILSTAMKRLGFWPSSFLMKPIHLPTSVSSQRPVCLFSSRIFLSVIHSSFASVYTLRHILGF